MDSWGLACFGLKLSSTKEEKENPKPDSGAVGVDEKSKA